MRSRISQREAHRLRKRLADFEADERARLARWASTYPGGVQIAEVVYDQASSVPVAIRTARALRHAVIVLENGGTLRYLALPNREPKQ
jgi:hypothetical protein